MINTHLRTYKDTSQLGLLLHIFCPPVCISRLHTYLISLFGYLLAMKRIGISRIRSNSTPVLALDINITAIPISFKSLLRQRRYIYIYLSFFFLLLYIFIHISFYIIIIHNLLSYQPTFNQRTTLSSGLRLQMYGFAFASSNNCWLAGGYLHIYTGR